MAAQPAASSRPPAAPQTVPAEGFEDELAQARKLGRLEAEAFDGRCLDREQQQREALLAGLALSGATSPARGGEHGPVSAGELGRLRSQVESLGAFHSAVLRSRSWRLLQAIRRPFGRAW